MSLDLDPKGLDWPGLMRAGITGLRLQPAQFWELTPVELRLLLGQGAGTGAMDRSGLQDLMASFPDGPQASACD